MKYIHMLEKNIPFYLIVNRAQTDKEGRETLTRLTNAMKQFLGKEITKLGMLPEDRSVSKAVARQTPFLLLDPATKVSRAMVEITDRYLSKNEDAEITMHAFNFFTKLRRFFLER
jgi:flagellar biosynthesis protein FlhG